MKSDSVTAIKERCKKTIENIQKQPIPRIDPKTNKQTTPTRRLHFLDVKNAQVEVLNHIIDFISVVEEKSHKFPT